MVNSPYLIAVTGGIGSGKSIVSRIVSTLGYPVYDCDSQAKILMDTSEAIKNAISSAIDSECVIGGNIDRRKLASIVFNNASKLETLNTIVHEAVRDHLSEWIHKNAGEGQNICFVETAILYQSKLDFMVDEVWEVEAPRELRIRRVMDRNGLTREEVTSRMESQDSFIPTAKHQKVRIIINDEDQPLLPQIEKLLDTLLKFM